MKKYFIELLSVVLFATVVTNCRYTKSQGGGDEGQKLYDIVTYVWSGAELMPNPQLVTAINYGFANMNESHDGLVIHNEPRFRQIIDLKKQKPELKVILCIGGDCNSGLSDMAGNADKRAALAGDCKRIIEQYGIDGIDFDWEVPGGPGGTPEDVDNFTLVLQAVRDSIGDDKILSLASGGDISFNVEPVLPLIDYVSIMAYDLGGQAPWHHTALYRSPRTGWHSVDEVVEIYARAGVPYDKMLLGLGFYGRGDDNYYTGWTNYSAAKPYGSLTQQWDSVAQVPYIADENGELVLGYDDPASLAIKCAYLQEKGMRGAMNWRTETDTDSLELARAVSDCLNHK